ncbi:MAG TPA: hypothetical protein VFJ77_01305 [Gaiellaceae bacterium]|nr:hypothetical protein [Gaiellaceae bacterium]
MRRAALCAALLALAAVPAARAALPRAGVLDPGRSLGGIRIGERAADVRAALGSFRGLCRGCARTTWYYTYRAFDPHGLAVEVRHGRVAGVYTLWQPPGWHDPRGLDLGAAEAQVDSLAGPLLPVACSGYTALVADRGRTRTVYYVAGGRLWAFGLFAHGADPCR